MLVFSENIAHVPIKIPESIEVTEHGDKSHHGYDGWKRASESCCSSGTSPPLSLNSSLLLCTQAPGKRVL